MKPILMAAALLFLPAAAQANAPNAPIDAFLAAFNKGDMAGIAAAHDAGDVFIIDEVPPHIWRGPKAVGAWLASLVAGWSWNGTAPQRAGR